MCLRGHRCSITSRLTSKKRRKTHPLQTRLLTLPLLAFLQFGMKIKGRESDTWHKKLKATASLKKPNDVDFPWTALQNHTGYYLKKKGTLLQAQIDARLLALVREDPSKDTALAACLPYVSTPAMRSFLGSELRLKPNSPLGPHEYLQLIKAIHCVNADVVNDLEEKWACCLMEHAKAGGSLGQQLHNMLDLLPARLTPGLLLQADIINLACQICGDFAMQLETLCKDGHWMNAHHQAEWLSTASTRHILQASRSGAKKLLDAHLPSWRVWAAWRPEHARLRAWNDYANRAPFLEDLFALEGPDFASMVGSEQATLQGGLVLQGLRDINSTLRWGNSLIHFQRNPWLGRENLGGLLERLTRVLDFACSGGHDYTALLAHLCVGKIINHEAVQILEDVQILGNPSFTKVILQIKMLPRQDPGPTFKEVKQLLPSLRDSRICALREHLKTCIAELILKQILELQNSFQFAIDANNQWVFVAKELLILMEDISQDHWLLANFDQSIRQCIVSRPSLRTIETLGKIYNSVHTFVAAPAPILSQIGEYCKAQLIPGSAALPHVRGLIEALMDVWQQPSDTNKQKLAILVTDIPDISYNIKCDYLRDVTKLTDTLIKSSLWLLEFPNVSSDVELFTFVLLLASERDLGRRRRWRKILSFAVDKQHDTFLNHALDTLTLEKWFELLNNIRLIYKECEDTKGWDPPKLLSQDLHIWSQKIALHFPTLNRLKITFKDQPIMRMLLLGLASSQNAQLLRILEIVKESESSYHENVMNIILAFLQKNNIHNVEESLSAVSKARLRGAEACLTLFNSHLQGSSSFTEVVFATQLRAGNLSNQDRLALRKVAILVGIDRNAEDNPSTGGLKEAANNIQDRYLKLIDEARRLENLRLSLQAIAHKDVSDLLLRLHIEAPSVVDDTLATLPASLATLIEKISEDEIELQFPANGLTKLQRFAIGLSDNESFLIRLTLSCNGKPIKFCVHLSADCSEGLDPIISANLKSHTPWEIHRGNRPPYENYCYGRPNRGVFQLSRIVWGHLRHNFQSLHQTHTHISSKLAKFGQGCMACGLGQYRLRRATTCPSHSCEKIFS